jgi:uncharacterized protein YydD (DUF2326 family)
LLFNQFKSGLGDMVEKSLHEVKDFKNRIDTFRNTIINEKLEQLKTQLDDINDQIKKLDVSYSDKLSLLGNGGLLKDLKTSIHIYNTKNQERENLRAALVRYEKAEKEKKTLKGNKDLKIREFDALIARNKDLIQKFEETILDIHEATMGNKRAHFDIKTVASLQGKEFLEFDFRINDDGSWSTNRMRVFIYDAAILFNENTRLRHPSLLVHDNLFNVDNDSLEKSLNFLHQQTEIHPGEFQYILTINREMVETMEAKSVLKFKVEDYERARFTKNERFLGKQYSERKGKRR